MIKTEDFFPCYRAHRPQTKKHPRSRRNRAPQRLFSVFGRVGGQILFDHQGHLEDDSVIELAQVETGELLDLFQAVDQGVAVYKQAAAGFGDIQVVFKEALDGEQRFGVQAVDAVLLEDFRKASHRVVGSW